MLDSRPAEVSAVPTDGGGQSVEVRLSSVYPAGLLLQGRMVGTLMAPAIHIDIAWGSDLWLFLVRSPWFPLKVSFDKQSLSVQHNAAKATASLSSLPGGTVETEVALEGNDFKTASLVVKRSLGSCTSNEGVCEVEAGSKTVEWRPILRAFDLLLVTKGSITESQLADIAKGLGAQVSSGIFFGPGGVEGDFVLCDGPAFSYTWSLKGHRGFLENEEDFSGAKFEW